MPDEPSSFIASREKFKAARKTEEQRLDRLLAPPMMNLVPQVKARVILDVHERYTAWVETRQTSLKNDPLGYTPGDFDGRAACFDGTNCVYNMLGTQELVSKESAGSYFTLLQSVADQLSGTPEVHGVTLEVVTYTTGKPETAFIAIKTS